LPLTDRDLTALVTGSRVSEDPAPLRNIAIRLSRLVDDQSEIARAEVWVALQMRRPRLRASIWIGPRRQNDDDPFIRRLPARPAELTPMRRRVTSSSP
jgi:hypothetical protein